MTFSPRNTIERELNVCIPDDYDTFLKRYGYYDESGVEVYGISENMVDFETIPCVIGATKNARKIYEFPKSFIVIHHTGIEDEVVLLDTNDGKVYLMSHGEIQKIADSFHEWFEAAIENEQ
ncbi:MAG: SMI1/KNR4 family protein [Desulfomonilaceae bacterium]